MNSKWLKLMRGLVVGLIVVVAVYTVMLVVSGVTLRHSREKLAAAGRPMMAELVIPVAVADGDNAALLYNSAAMALKATGDAWGKLTPEQLSGSNREDVVKFLESKEVRAAVELLKKGTEKAGCRYELDYSKGPGILLPHVSELRNLSRLLASQARLQIERKEYDMAWSNVIAGYRLADALRTEPMLISQLVRIAMFGITDQVAMDLCKASPPTEAQSEAVANAVKPFVDVAPLVRAMDGERLLLGDWVFRQSSAELVNVMSMDGHAGASVMNRMAVRVVFCKPVRQLMQASYLQVMGEITAAMATPCRESSTSELRLIEANIPRWDIVSRMMVPALGGVKIKQAGLMAKAVLTQTAMGLMRHKLAHQGFPATLAECDAKFLPVQSVDLFTGKPLVYKPDGNGFLLYSFGENMKDDGGKAEPGSEARNKMSPKEREEKAWDLVWTCK